jgi:hypothetical protein
MNVTTHEEHLSTADLAEAASSQNQPSAPMGAAAESSNRALFPEDVATDFRGKWDRIQTGFVDEPRNAVQQADELVAQVIKRLAESFSQPGAKSVGTALGSRRRGEYRGSPDHPADVSLVFSTVVGDLIAQE